MCGRVTRYGRCDLKWGVQAGYWNLSSVRTGKPEEQAEGQSAQGGSILEGFSRPSWASWADLIADPAWSGGVWGTPSGPCQHKLLYDCIILANNIRCRSRMSISLTVMLFLWNYTLVINPGDSNLDPASWPLARISIHFIDTQCLNKADSVGHFFTVHGKSANRIFQWLLLNIYKKEPN